MSGTTNSAAGTTNSADSVGTQVSRILSDAQFTAAELLDEADNLASRAGRDELAKLRGSLEERLETLRTTRARLNELSAETVPRVREAAAELAAMPAALAEASMGLAGEALEAEEEAKTGPPSHLVALIKAAESIADELTEEARKRAAQLEEAARREVERVASEEPDRLTKAYDPATRRAEALRRALIALNQEFDEEDDAETPGSQKG